MRYPGGKSKLQPRIAEQLFKTDYWNREYREPFFGGGSIGLSVMQGEQHRVNSVWINDKDEGMSCLWTAIIRYPEEFKKQINAFTPSVQAFHDFKEELIASSETVPTAPEDIVRVGFKKLAVHQISYSGLGTKSGGPLGGEQQKSKYKIDCRWSRTF